jgi:tRNA G18 (ribose-2'-O)-methylase SpoU
MCDHRITIPVTDKVDSLNLGVAAGIFMYALQYNTRITRD